MAATHRCCCTSRKASHCPRREERSFKLRTRQLLGHIGCRCMLCHQPGTQRAAADHAQRLEVRVQPSYTGAARHQLWQPSTGTNWTIASTTMYTHAALCRDMQGEGVGNGFIVTQGSTRAHGYSSCYAWICLSYAETACWAWSSCCSWASFASSLGP